MKKFAISMLALSLVAGAAQAQSSPAPVTILEALPSTSCFANNRADAALLQPSMEGLRNTSSTRTVWVTCSVPTVRVIGPFAPNDDIQIGYVEMGFRTSLARATMPCKVYVKIGGGFGDPNWGQATSTQGGRGLVHINPATQSRHEAEAFAIQCKLPQASTLVEFTVAIRQFEWLPIE